MISSLIFAVWLAGASPVPAEIARGVTLVPGAVPDDRGPDGNTIIFDAPDGLVVVDTGRHVWHSDAILELASRRARPVAAIINTHWHLDHSSGNTRLRAVFPEAPVYATQAVGRALQSEGFLARNYAAARAHVDSGEASEIEREERGIFIATMETAGSLRPTQPLAASGRHRFGGRRLEVHIAEGAVTDADIWLYDRRTRVAVLGDLVTLPAPFFETACPERWRAALDQVYATPFRIAVPGHGAPMNREQFSIYRAAFGAFLDCVNSDVEASACAAAWTQSVASLMSSSEARQAPAYAAYYVAFLRTNGGTSPECLVG